MCEQGAIPTSIIEDDDTLPLFSNATTMEIPAVPEMVSATSRNQELVYQSVEAIVSAPLQAMLSRPSRHSPPRPASQWSPEALSRLLADVRRS